MDRFKFVRSSWAAPAAAGIAAAILSLPLLAYPFIWDQAVFANIAEAMARGGVVYRDGWEHKPPGVYYVYALAFSLLGRDYWPVRLLEILAIGAAGAGLARVGIRWFGSVWAGIVSAVALPALYLLFGQNTAQPESFQIPLIAWAMALWPLEGERERLRTRAFASALLISAAAMFKTPAVTFGFALLLDRLAQDWKEPTWKQKFASTGIVAAGLASLPAAVFAYYSARGAFVEVWDALVVFPLHYNRWAGSRPLSAHLSFAEGWVESLLPWTALILVGLAIARGLLLRRTSTVRWAGWMAAAAADVAMQGTYHNYVHLALLVPLSLGLGLILMRGEPVAEPAAWRIWIDRAFRVAGPVALVLAAIPYGHALSFVRHPFGRIARVPYRDDVPPAPLQEGRPPDVVTYIRSQTKPDDRLFVWGDEPLLYFLCNRPMAGPYSHLLVMIPPWGGAERLYPLIARLGAEKPRVIVVCSGQSWWSPTMGPRQFLDAFPDMRQFLRDDYEKTASLEGHDVWRRKE
jgi:4-amino-4-deoxy-L-arabinose transferase-like glycosyltransferase